MHTPKIEEEMWCSHPKLIPRVSSLQRACAEACFTTSSLVQSTKAIRLELIQAKIQILQSFILHATLAQVRARKPAGAALGSRSELALVHVLELQDPANLVGMP